MTEEWRQAIGFEGWYEVSNLGRVKRVKAANATHVGRVIAPSHRKSGHLSVYLRGDAGETQRQVHRLVAAAFIGPCPDGKEVNHIDGNPANNRVENLEYCTRSENIAHAYRLGLMKAKRGEDVPWSKLTAEQVMVIRGCQNVPARVLSRVFQVSHVTILNIRHLKLWRHLA